MTHRRWYPWHRRHRRVLVLSGGSAKAAAQVGMARALIEHGWVPDAIVGASAGALNAVHLANDWSTAGVDELDRLWHQADGATLFPGRRINRLVRLVRGEASLYAPDGLTQFIRDAVSVDDLAECAIPVCIAVVDLDAGQTRWKDTGPALPWLLASCSIPGVLPPVLIEDRLYADGGCVTPVPLAGATMLEPTEVFVGDVSDTTWKHKPSPGPLDTLLGAYQSARVRATQADLNSLGAHAERLYWCRVGGPGPALDDFARTGELIEAGYAAGLAAVARGGRDHALARLVTTPEGADTVEHRITEARPAPAGATREAGAALA